jgi:aspartyl-tRNA(Asn)/glutamyl-tRNA(Gln) amidotransferase subunit A
VAGGDLAFRDATELADLVRTKQVSPMELVRLYLERIERLDRRLRAYITVRGNAALEAARRAEAAVQAGGRLGPLHGVPFAVKDQFDTQGLPTTMGSRVCRVGGCHGGGPAPSRRRAAPRQAESHRVRPRRYARVPLRPAAQSLES